MVNNKKLARIFEEIAELLEIKGVSYKPKAYKKAARILRVLDKDVSDIYKESGLDGIKKIPGVGKSIAQ